MNTRVNPVFDAREYILPSVLAVALVLIVTAMLTGTSDDKYSAEWDTTGMTPNGNTREWFSVEVIDLKSKDAQKYNIPQGVKGVIVTEVEGNKDLRMKLKNGDVIRGVNRTEITNVRDFRKASQKINPNNGLLLDIVRTGYPMYITLPGMNGTVGTTNQNTNWHNPDHMRMNEVAPVFGQDLGNAMAFESGGMGREIENWINSHTGSYYACNKCGTMVPYNDNMKNRNIFCPNCGNVMKLK